MVQKLRPAGSYELGVTLCRQGWVGFLTAKPNFTPLPPIMTTGANVGTLPEAMKQASTLLQLNLYCYAQGLGRLQSG